MNIQTWAQQIFQSTHLEDKLQSPKGLKDAPGLAAKLSHRPSRTSSTAKEASFLDLAKTQNPTDCDKARALHAFANHELLAIECMAHFLLRFPEADKALRKSMVATIEDEQRHFRLYCVRLGELGYGFSDFNSSTMFWDFTSKIATPKQFLAVMSLTFEQANLDFAAYFVEYFSKVGDFATANVLKVVLEDEIKHVAKGLYWFKKDCSEPLFEEFCRHAPSPSRAKGLQFNWEARKRAGLDEVFCQKLFVYPERTDIAGKLFIPNLFCEMEHKKGRVRALNTDLALLGLPLLSPHDSLLLEEVPEPGFLATLKRLGIKLPRFVTSEKGKFSSQESWGIENSSFGKAFSHEVYGKFLQAYPLYEWDTLGIVCTNLTEFEAAKKEFVRKGITNLRVKPDLSAFGKGHLRAHSNREADATLMNFLLSAFKRAQPVVVEPQLNRTLDFSMLGMIEGGKIKTRGFTVFHTDAKGRFLGCSLGDGFRAMDPALKARLFQAGVHLHKVYEDTVSFVGTMLEESGYEGPFGVDGMVYDDVKIRPIVEVNARYTVGFVAQKLGRLVHPNSRGMLKLCSVGDFEELPVQKIGEKISAGRFFLTDPRKARIKIAGCEIRPRCSV